MASLLLVIGLIGAGSLAFRRFVQGRGLSFRQQGKVIEVISTQSMGPKRSIALIKVLDQHMVVGMSGDGMSLLANLGTNVNLDKFMEEPGAGASFNDTLQSTISGGTGAVSARDVAGGGGIQFSFRDSIKKRLVGFKPL